MNISIFFGFGALAILIFVFINLYSKEKISKDVVSDGDLNSLYSIQPFINNLKDNHKENVSKNNKGKNPKRKKPGKPRGKSSQRKRN